jgi:hypothetical protein
MVDLDPRGDGLPDLNPSGDGLPEPEDLEPVFGTLGPLGVPAVMPRGLAYDPDFDFQPK